jgi:hypothetical protein
MTNEISTWITVTLDCKNGDLPHYPSVNKYTFKFDATDMTIQGHVEQFRIILRASGFAEKTIREALGEF